MHSVRVHIQRRKPALAKVVFWSAVVFPYVEFDEESAEWHSWQVIDQQLFRARPLPASLTLIMERARQLLSSTGTSKWFNAESKLPNTSEAEEIASLLRPNFEVFESPKSRLERWSEEVRHYTEEQFVALDGMEGNPRVLFSGPAGTGKTLLAIEATRRSQIAGRRTLFVCFNRLLGSWLATQTASLGSGVTVGTFHRQLVSLVGGISARDEDRPGFWENDLPVRAIDVLLADDLFKPYEEIVLDEAQDLLHPHYLDVFDLLVTGGLSSGRWCFFGDFERQVIYKSGSANGQDLLSERAGKFPTFRLRVNCRNSPRIASLTHLLGGLTPDYKRVLRPDNGVEPQLLYYSNQDEQVALLLSTLENWYRDGIPGREIIVLSPRSESLCLAALIKQEPWRSRLRPQELRSGGNIGYCSIHSFKGMEAPAVIVTDIDRVSGETAADLFYVGITRALHRLTILVTESGRKEIVTTLLKLHRESK
jgi:DNA polymerase III delta prime subunit